MINLTKHIQAYFVRRAIKEAVRQGNQFYGIETLFGSIVEEARKVYTEDNVTTLNAFLRERLEVALKHEHDAVPNGFTPPERMPPAPPPAERNLVEIDGKVVELADDLATDSVEAPTEDSVEAPVAGLEGASSAIMKMCEDHGVLCVDGGTEKRNVVIICRGAMKATVIANADGSLTIHAPMQDSVVPIELAVAGTTVHTMDETGLWLDVPSMDVFAEMLDALKARERAAA